MASLELHSDGALPSDAVCELQHVQAQAAGHHRRVSEPELQWRSLLANRGLPAAQYTELQQVKAQAAGYHRRDLDALQATGRLYADLGLRAREAFLKELEHVLGSLSWCVCYPEKSDTLCAHLCAGLLDLRELLRGTSGSLSACGKRHCMGLSRLCASLMSGYKLSLESASPAQSDTACCGARTAHRCSRYV